VANNSDNEGLNNVLDKTIEGKSFIEKKLINITTI
jgi:hypothetical protein